MLVLKFGGTSVGSAENIEKVITIVREKLKTGKLLVVVSAMGGTTDALLECGKLAAAGNEAYKEKLREIEQRHISTVKELIPVQQQSALLSMVKKMCNEIEDLCNGIFLLNELSVRTIDELLSYGELLSSQMITAALVGKGTEARWVDSREVIKTNSEFGSATVDYSVTNKNIRSLINTSDTLFIVPGFVASDAKNITTTLGRGGSDFTAAIFAAAVDSSSLEIWTDVSGMMTADPRWVANAKIISSISYQEAMELSHFGAKVIYPPTIQPVLSKNIPVWIKNTFAPGDNGTLIQNETSAQGQKTISGISSINKIPLLSLEGSGMIGIPGFSKRLFESLAGEQINVILITQSSSEHSICV